MTRQEILTEIQQLRGENTLAAANSKSKLMRQLAAMDGLTAGPREHNEVVLHLDMNYSGWRGCEAPDIDWRMIDAV